MWRYREVLPLAEGADKVSLGEGFTPLLAAPRLGARLGLPRLAVKEEGGNPTGSFKARGLSMAVSMAKALGATDVCLPSAGNAGSALAAYAARRGPQGPRLPAEGHRPALRDGDRGLRRSRRDGRRPHHRRGPALRGAGEGARLVRVRDLEGALPRRGQEDDGLRDRGADGLDAARRDPLPDRRRHRPRGDVEGVRRDGDDGLRRREAAPDVRGAGRGLRADRQGLPGGTRGRPVLGERDHPRPRPARAEGAR